jgi:DNA-binding protein H-NS
MANFSDHRLDRWRRAASRVQRSFIALTCNLLQISVTEPTRQALNSRQSWTITSKTSRATWCAGSTITWAGPGRRPAPPSRVD